MGAFTVILLVAGIGFFLYGIALKVFPGALVNSGLGYRSAFARRSVDTLKEANRYAAQQALIFGNLMFALAVAGFFLKLNQLAGILSSLAVTAFFLCVLYSRTEKRLHALFNDNGIRKPEQG